LDQLAKFALLLPKKKLAKFALLLPKKKLAKFALLLPKKNDGPSEQACLDVCK
jgi:hypothetical protein